MMKKHILVLAIAALALTAGCSKNVKCKCTALTPNDLDKYEVTYVTADRGISCKKIHKLGIERLLEGQYVRDLVDVKCEEARD